MGIPTPNARSRRVTALFDFSRGRGLEIGPLDAAMVPRDAADVSYADVFPRERLVEHYRAFPIVRTELIPEIDYPLWDGERVRPLNEAAKPGAPFDWVYASHVIEHVPDMIGWLEQISELTADDGALVLVVPDQRFSFDVHRPATTIGQLIQAHDDGDTMPSVRAVYDHHRSAINAHARVLWAKDIPGYDARIHDLGHTLAQLEKARAGNYVDSHVWLFTPETFREQLDELHLLGLTPWWVERLEPTPQGELEFCAVLRRGPKPESAAATAGEAEPVVAQPLWIAEMLQQRAEIERLRGVVKRQRRELRAMRSSKRWKTAQLLARPLDAVRRLR